MSMELGRTGRAETTVTPDNTAAAMGSGSLPVFATPAMVALMEEAAVNACRGALDEGETTVGTRMEVSHDAASPLGMAVRAEAALTAVEGGKRALSVRAGEAAGPIGGGVHQRFVVTAERFLAKTARRGEV